jgi:hypothetical protein
MKTMKIANNMEQKCQICGKEMKTVPAGTSKRTGKAYSAFLSCPDRCKQPMGINTFTKGGVTLEEVNSNVLRIIEYLGVDPTVKKTNEALETINTEDIPF